MKKFKYFLLSIMILSCIVGCSSEKKDSKSDKTTETSSKKTEKEKKKVKLLNDNQYYIDIANNLDWFHTFVGNQYPDFNGNGSYFFDSVDSLTNEQMDYYLNWDFIRLLNKNVYNLKDYPQDSQTGKSQIPMSIINDLSNQLFGKDYYLGNEETFDYIGGIGGIAPGMNWNVENPVLQDDGTILIKSIFTDENNNVVDSNTLCIKEIDAKSFRIISVKK